jgi:basic membrane protein A and related proteins
VAAIYTVPTEQQWVSRIHLAANTARDRGDIEYVYTENVSNADYERVMREYAEAGHDLIIGEVFGVEDAAREVAADYPDTAFLMGSSFKEDAALPELRGVRQLHPGCRLPDRPRGGLADGDEEHRHGRRLSDPRGQPAHARLHGRRARDRAGRPASRSPSSAPGSTRRQPRRRRSPTSMPVPTSCMPNASACRMPRRSAAFSPSAMSSTPRMIIPTRWRLGDLAFRADARQAAIEEVRAGTFEAADYGVYSFMQHGGSSMAPLGTFEDRVSDEIKALVAQREAEIKAGDFVVNINDDEPRSG